MAFHLHRTDYTTLELSTLEFFTPFVSFSIRYTILIFSQSKVSSIRSSNKLSGESKYSVIQISASLQKKLFWLK